MISVEAALARVLELGAVLGVEMVPLAQAAGRVLARDAVAGRDQPPFDAAAMDGYAVADVVAGGETLRVIGAAQAGAAFSGVVGAGAAVRVFTGAPVPAGATRVVIQEDVVAEGDRITVSPRVEGGPHIRPRGADFRAGFRLTAPRRLRPVEVALLAAMNVAQVAVVRRPVVAFIATGDELVMPGALPGPDQIIASNTFALAAMAQAEGAEARMMPIARDDAETLAHVFGLAAGADLIVTVGGASVGDHDLVAPVAARLGMAPAFHKVALRPGKPLMAGRIGGAAFLGLPGNPVSAIVCGHLFMLPLIRAMQGLPGAVALRAGVLARDVPANGPRAHYMRARVDDGMPPAIDPFPDQDSARLHLLSQAGALLVRPVGDCARKAGDPVAWIAL